MSVIVRGMEMPTNCLQCSFVRTVSDHHYCGCNANCMLGEYVGEYLEGARRHDGCPLVELPARHGRLIDGDALYDSLGVSDEDIYFKYMLEECPTIVEAEGD